MDAAGALTAIDAGIKLDATNGVRVGTPAAGQYTLCSISGDWVAKGVRPGPQHHGGTDGHPGLLMARDQLQN